MAADDITERFSDIQDELIADATKAESERDAALARVAELETLVEKMQPVYENVMNTITKIKRKSGLRELAVRGATWKRRKSLSLPDSLMVIRITLLRVTLSVSCHTNGFPLKMVVSGVWHLNKVVTSD